MMPYDYFYGYPTAGIPAGVASSSEVRNASELARNAEQRARETQDRYERLALATQAMWCLLQEKFSLTDQELKEKIMELDLTDGKLDGKIRRTPLPCPKCSRMNAPRLARCLFCSEPLPKQPFA